jgi:Putative F0F1-ATPase subunit Ca2+/Mg2+ transporter
MKMVNDKKNNTRYLSQIIMLSAWSFTIVISSFIFLFVGRWIDVNLNTEPTFMVGLFVLAVFLCVARLYVDFNRTSEQIRKISGTSLN